MVTIRTDQPTPKITVKSGYTPAVIESLEVSPSTEQQVIETVKGVDGFNPITVNPVTSAIDDNIKAENIKKDVEILGVSGMYEFKSGEKTIELNGTYTAADENLDGYSSVKINVQGYPEMPNYVIENNVVKRRYAELPKDFLKGVTKIEYMALDREWDNFINFSTLDGITGTLDLSSLKTIENNGLYCTFYQTRISGTLNLSNVEEIGYMGLYNAFTSTKISGEIYMPKLTSLDKNVGNYTGGGSQAMQNTFSQTEITRFLLPNLKNIGIQSLAYVCSGCSYLTEVDLSSLEKLADSGLLYAFRGCIQLKTLSFPKLSTIGQRGLNYICQGCYRLESLYFYALNENTFKSYKNQLYNMFNNQTVLYSEALTVHFPSNMEETIATLTGYPTFGATASKITLAFDLPSTAEEE